MTSALARRSKLLIVAGAIVLALIVNAAWVAFGPEAGSSGRGQELEGLLLREWVERGVPVRSVSCSQRASAWTCRIDRTAGGAVECALGSAPHELLIDPRHLADTCHSR